MCVRHFLFDSICIGHIACCTMCVRHFLFDSICVGHIACSCDCAEIQVHVYNRALQLKLSVCMDI